MSGLIHDPWYIFICGALGGASLTLWIFRWIDMKPEQGDGRYLPPAMPSVMPTPSKER